MPLSAENIVLPSSEADRSDRFWELMLALGANANAGC